MKYSIEKDIPAPRIKPGSPGKYPFATMAIGDSFSFPASKRKVITKAAAMYRSRHPPWSYQIALDVEGKWRCWRLGDLPLFVRRKYDDEI